MQKKGFVQQTAYCHSCGIEIAKGDYCEPCDPETRRRGTYVNIHYTEFWSKPCRCSTHRGPHWMISDWPFWEALLEPLAIYESHLQGFELLLKEEVQRMEDHVLHHPTAYDITHLVAMKERVYDISWARLTYERLLLQAKHNVADHMETGHIIVEKGTDILLLFSLLSHAWQQRVATHQTQRGALYASISGCISHINELATRGNAFLRELLFV